MAEVRPNGSAEPSVEMTEPFGSAEPRFWLIGRTLLDTKMIICLLYVRT